MSSDESRIWSLISRCHGRSEAMSVSLLSARTGLGDRMITLAAQRGATAIAAALAGDARGFEEMER